MRRLQISRTTTVGLCIALFMTCALGIVAQSGRRVSKSTPAPVPTPEATPAPTPTAKPQPTFRFIVGLDRYGDFSRVPLTNYGGVLHSCADRLDDSQLVEAVVSSGDISRAEAIRRARAEKEAYIVWLQLRANTFSGQTGANDDPSNVYIQYFVFAPGTAKQMTSGNTYPEAYRVKGIRVPTSPANGDYYLNQAARGAAERILDHFHLRLPDKAPVGLKAPKARNETSGLILREHQAAMSLRTFSALSNHPPSWGVAPGCYISRLWRSKARCE